MTDHPFNQPSTDDYDGHLFFRGLMVAVAIWAVMWVGMIVVWVLS